MLSRKGGYFLGLIKYFFVPIPQFLAKNLLYEKEGDLDSIALDDEARADTYRSGI